MWFPPDTSLDLDNPYADIQLATRLLAPSLGSIVKLELIEKVNLHSDATCVYI